MMNLTPFKWPPLRMHTIDLITISTNPKAGLDLAGKFGPDDIEYRSCWMICRHINTTSAGDGRYLVRIRLTQSPAPGINNLVACFMGGKCVQVSAEVESWAKLLQTGWMYPHKAN